jgi:hypothetical protein
MKTQHKEFTVTLTPARALDQHEVKLAESVSVKASIPYVDGDAEATAKLYKTTQGTVVDGFIANTVVQIQDGCRRALGNALSEDPTADPTSVVQDYVDDRMRLGKTVKLSRQAQAEATVKAAGLSKEAEAASLEAVALALGKKSNK